MYGDLAPKSTREKFIEVVKYTLAILGLVIVVPLALSAALWVIKFCGCVVGVLGPQT
jgi:hypothetical protein